MRNFYFCHNPLGRLPPGRVAYIYHPDNPRIFASLIEIDYNKRLIDLNFKGCNVIFEYEQADGKRRVFLLIVMQGGQQNVTKTIAILKDAAGWYTTCLNKEDIKTKGKGGTWSLMHPYNKEYAPSLDVIHIRSTDQYLMSYGTGTFCAEGLDHMERIIDMLYTDEHSDAKVEASLNFVE